MNTIDFSLALTTFNRAKMLIPFIQKYETYAELKEIIVLDDCSDDFNILKKEAWNPKVRIETNNINFGAYKNKLKVLSLTKCPWIILFDSDNFFEKDFIKILQNEENLYGLDENIIYCPTKALPNFVYQNMENKIIDKNIWNDICRTEDCFLNTGNMCLSRKAVDILLLNYQKDHIKNPFVECKYMNYIFVKNGFKLKGMENLSYTHNLSSDSHYITHQANHQKFNNTFDWILR